MKYSFILLAFLFLPISAYASQCVDDLLENIEPRPERRFEEVDAVFVGKITSKEGLSANIKVIKAWKGVHSSHVKLQYSDHLTYSPTNTFPYSVESKEIIFFADFDEERNLSISECSKVIVLPSSRNSVSETAYLQYLRYEPPSVFRTVKTVLVLLIIFLMMVIIYRRNVRLVPQA